MQQLCARRAAVDGDDHGDIVQIPLVGILPARRRPEPHRLRVLPLKFLLVLDHEGEVSDIIHHDAVVIPALEVPHAIRKVQEVADLTFNGALNRDIANSVLPQRLGAKRTRMGKRKASGASLANKSRHWISTGNSFMGLYKVCLMRLAFARISA